MYGIYEQMTTLQYRYHCLLQQLEAFKSGEKYRKMDEEYKKLLRFTSLLWKRRSSLYAFSIWRYFSPDLKSSTCFDRQRHQYCNVVICS